MLPLDYKWLRECACYVPILRAHNFVAELHAECRTTKTTFILLCRTLVTHVQTLRPWKLSEGEFKFLIDLQSICIQILFASKQTNLYWETWVVLVWLIGALCTVANLPVRFFWGGGLPWYLIEENLSLLDFFFFLNKYLKLKKSNLSNDQFPRYLQENTYEENFNIVYSLHTVHLFTSGKQHDVVCHVQPSAQWVA